MNKLLSLVDQAFTEFSEISKESLRISSAKQNSGFKILRLEEAKTWLRPLLLTLMLFNVVSRINIFS